MIFDCAIAMDGGSLALVVKGLVGQENYTLIRSISSVGTDRYERIEYSGGLLSETQENDFCAKLTKMQASLSADSPCADILAEFIKVLRRRNAEPSS
jgi:hypothetical protein